jgi:signal transduction histidine kinase
MAHEVNNSLDTMQNCLHLLDRRVHPAGDEAYQLLRTEAARLARLVREILGLYRGPQSSRPADLNTVVTETVQSLQPRLRDGKVRVSMSLGQLPRIAVSPAQLRMVASNLIANAIDAMPRGGEMRIETQRFPAGRGRPAHTVRVCLRVADTGVGIPAELKSRIFQPFVTSKGGRGTGLGLWIVAQIVAHNGGHVRALPRKGGGSIFEVEFACKKAKS